MLKTAATYVTFLIIVSCLYYVTYWWAFNIDVLPFLEPQNLILGLIFPLRYSGVYFILACLGNVILAIIDYNKEKRRNEIPNEITELEQKSGKLVSYIESTPREEINIRDIEDIRDIQKKMISLAKEYLKISDTPRRTKRNKIIANFSIILIIALITSLGIAFFYEPASKLIMVLFSYTIATSLVGYLRINDVIPRNIFLIDEVKKDFIYAADISFLTLIAFFFISAIATGYSESQSIIRGVRFNYTLNRDLPGEGSLGYKIYLGAIRDKFIFSDSINQEHTIMDKDTLKILKTRFYDSQDASSVDEFRKLTRLIKTRSKEDVISDKIKSKSVRHP